MSCTGLQTMMASMALCLGTRAHHIISNLRKRTAMLLGEPRRKITFWSSTCPRSRNGRRQSIGWRLWAFRRCPRSIPIGISTDGPLKTLTVIGSSSKTQNGVRDDRRLLVSSSQITGCLMSGREPTSIVKIRALPDLSPLRIVMTEQDRGAVAFMLGNNIQRGEVLINVNRVVGRIALAQGRFDRCRIGCQEECA